MKFGTDFVWDMEDNIEEREWKVIHILSTSRISNCIILSDRRSFTNVHLGSPSEPCNVCRYGDLDCNTEPET